MTIINSTAVSASFTPSTYNGNAPIRYYVLIANNVIVGKNTGSPIIGTGLSSVNTEFTVAAVNDVGLGTRSTSVYATPSNTPVNLTLPTISGAPSNGATLSTTTGTWSHTISSYSYQWQRNGSNIGGATSSTYTLGSSDVDQVVRCIVTATSATSGGTASANTANTRTIVYAPPTVEYLVVAGGGGGGYGADSYGSGGGGAGGYLTASGYSVTADQSISVTVGAGGSPAFLTYATGQNSVFGSITSVGGGGGGWIYGSGVAGGGGGSGGGGAGRTGFTATSGGANTVGQGNRGGAGFTGNPVSSGGGGGGASSVGLEYSSTTALANGGNGSTSSISGASVTYAGGGGGGSDNSLTNGPGYGGSGGGGNGGGFNRSASPGTDGLGGGGGGGGWRGSFSLPQAGGRGVVIIRYANTYSNAYATTGTPTFTDTGGYKIYKWDGSGSITF